MTEIQIVIKGIQDKFKKNLLKIIKTEAGPKLIELVMDQYRLQLEGIAPETDPTAPEYWKDEFRNLLVQDLERTLSIDGNTIRFGIGNREELGYYEELSPTSTEVLKTFVYILEGIVGSYAWITEEIYRQRHPKTEDFNWGRFGAGFLLSEERFYAEGWDNVVDFETVRFGFSDEGPKYIFQEAYRRFKIKPFVEKAIKQTLQEIKQEAGQ